MLKKWLKAGYMEKHVLHPTEAGTPQGGIISPVLANLTLDGLERMLMEHFPKVKTAKGSLVNFARYADDFIVTGRTKELLEREVKPRIEQFMSERGLQLSQEKTTITHIEDGFDFLGQNVRKYKAGKRHKLLIKPSNKNVQAHLEKIRETKKNSALSAGKLILLLNPIIRGWAQYHQHVVSKEIFNSVDDAIYRRLRQWMKRRHPKKSAALSANPDISIRTREPDNIVQEMEAVAWLYGATSFRFVDDLFLASPPFMRRCLRRFVEQGIGNKYVWDATGRINILSRAPDSLLDVMQKAGCREVALGIESGSERMLGYIDKRITPEMIRTSVRRLTSRAAKERTAAQFFLLGRPACLHGSMWNEGCSLTPCVSSDFTVQSSHHARSSGSGTPARTSTARR